VVRFFSSICAWWMVRDSSPISRLQSVGNPLYRPLAWGEMRESNSRGWSHNPVPAAVDVTDRRDNAELAPILLNTP